MRVPVAASSRIGIAETFEERLQQATTPSEPANETADAPDETPADETAPAEEPAATADEPRDPADPVAEDRTPAQRAATAEPPARAVTDALPPSTRRGEPELRIDAGKDSGSPRTSAQPLAPELPNSAANKTTAVAGAPGTGASARTNGPALPAANVRAEPTTAVKNAPLRPGALQTGYRTLTTQSVQLVEQARDSVFKQILFKLDQGGGEMRLRLEPPELGELDLRLVVENGSQLRLSIGAERPDLAQVLARDLDQLRHALQQHGLQITHAEVHTGTGSARGDDRDAGFGAGPDTGRRDAAPSDAARPARGFLSAQSLDFWA
jgi:hypothetical protein